MSMGDRPFSEPAIATLGASEPIDNHVGARIRARRLRLGMTPAQLASAVGVTRPQLLKYESGVNRITSGRLADIARALEVSIDWFFAGSGTEDDDQVEAELIEAVRKIRNPAAKEHLLGLARLLAESDQGS